MELKVKLSQWSAGFHVVMLKKETAKMLGVHAKDRLSVNTLSKKPKQMFVILDVIKDSLKDDEIYVSSEVKERLSLTQGQKIEVTIASPPKSLVFIKEKLDKKPLSEDKIKKITKDIVNNSLSEAEIALFISAMYGNGMNFQETIYLIKSILNSGERISLKNKFVVDKHSIGGIPGNRTTPIVVSICASQGLIFPKTSSRAITSAAGTADVLETLTKVEFSAKELKKIISKAGACMVWGGALEMVPADSKIISIEKQLGLDPEANLLASIISKKLAVSSKYILIDIPYGKTAKVNKKNAFRLKKKFEEIGKYFKLKIKVVLTNGSQPIGNGIGPVLEMKDVLSVLLQHKDRPLDLEKKSLFLAGNIFEMTGKAKKGKGIKLAKNILNSGKAYKKFHEIITAQGGRVKELRRAKFKKNIASKANCRIKEINNDLINSLARFAGCPLDKSAGIYLYKHVGDEVKKGEPIFTIYAESKARLNETVRYYYEKKPIYFC